VKSLLPKKLPHNHLGDSGQAMIEACILIPVLLSLFLGLWHYALLSQAQTRSILAARHVAWARATLDVDDSKLKTYAAPFFPVGTALDVQAERQTSTYADYYNMLTSYCAAFTIVDNDNQHKITLSASVPALPFAPPQAPGRNQAGYLDFLAKAQTHPVVVVRNYCGETPRSEILSLFCFMCFRPDLLVEAGIKIAISEAFTKFMSFLGETIGESSWFSSFMGKLGLEFLEDVFPQISEAILWLVNDIIEIIKAYSS
jgi:hypothetical protein